MFIIYGKWLKIDVWLCYATEVTQMNNRNQEIEMSPNTKIELAREIMNFMIGRYGKNGYDRNNQELMQILADEKAMKHNDMAAVDRIIKVYGPIASSKREGN